MKSVKLGYGILLCITLILAIINNAYHIFLLLIVELLLPVFLFLYLLYCKQCLSIKLIGERDSCNKDEKIPMSIEIVNKGMFPITNVQIDIHYANRYLPQGEHAMLVTSVFKKQVTQFFVTSKHCGELNVKIHTVTIFDPFSLFSKKIDLSHSKYDKEFNVIVLPDIYEEKTMTDRLKPANGIDDLFSLHKSGNDPTEVFDIREYRDSDKLQQIHWKLSLKQEQLIVREFSLPICDCFTLFIDFNVNNFSEDVLSLIDSMLETIFTLSYYLQSNYVVHNITWFDMRSQNIEHINITSEDDIYRAIQCVFLTPLYKGEPKGKQLYFTQFFDESRNNILYFEPGNIPDVLDEKGA